MEALLLPKEPLILHFFHSFPFFGWKPHISPNCISPSTTTISQLTVFFNHSRMWINLTQLLLLILILPSIVICQISLLSKPATRSSIFSRYVKYRNFDSGASLTSRHLLGADTYRFCDVQPDPNNTGSYICQTRNYVTVRFL
jgi:hypothetical protein